MYGKERDNDLINKLNKVKSNVMSHSLSSAETIDFMINLVFYIKWLIEHYEVVGA